MNFEDILICPKTGEKLYLEEGHLVSPSGNTYPIVDGIPILIDDSQSLFKQADFVFAKKTFFSNNPLKRAIFHLIPTLGLNYASKRNLKKAEALLSGSGSKPRILTVGGSIEGEGAKEFLNSSKFEVIDTDVTFGPRTKVICDGHSLPFADASVDMVIIQAVLEHVLDPVQCVKEIHRVLKPDGIVYSEIPFMQQVHGKAFDFTRFSFLGQRRLFRNFELIDMGPTAGPGSSLSWAYVYFLMGFSNNFYIRVMLRLFGTYTSFYLKYFDLLTKNKASTLDGASGIYFLGRKSDITLDDATLIANYKGGFRSYFA
jgi:SAM-dependent methyltransferase